MNAKLLVGLLVLSGAALAQDQSVVITGGIGFDNKNQCVQTCKAPPAAVYSVDQAQAFHARVVLNSGADGNGNRSAQIPVPQGFTLIIENISGSFYAHHHTWLELQVLTFLELSDQSDIYGIGHIVPLGFGGVQTGDRGISRGSFAHQPKLYSRAISAPGYVGISFTEYGPSSNILVYVNIAGRLVPNS